MSSLSWKRFRARASKAPFAGNYEPLEADPWHSLEIFAPDKPAKAAFFFTRPYLCKLWLQQGDYPDNLVSIVHYGVPSRSYWKMIKDITTKARLPLYFIGDLDPLDLTAFVALRCGDPDLAKPNRRALPIIFGGVDDIWLGLCQQSLLPKWKSSPAFRMSPIEIEHRDVILGLAPWLLDEIGPRCAELLKAGMKLELEGASSPAFYGKDFPRELLKYFLVSARWRARNQA